MRNPNDEIKLMAGGTTDSKTGEKLSTLDRVDKTFSKKDHKKGKGYSWYSLDLGKASSLTGIVDPCEFWIPMTKRRVVIQVTDILLRAESEGEPTNK